MSAEGATPRPDFRLRDLVRRGAEPPPAGFIARLGYYPWLIVGVTCIGAFMGQLDASIVQLALPTLGRVFDTSLESVSWVALGYLIAFASFLPIFGQLCEIFGRKLLYLIGFLLFTTASALCGFAPDLVSLTAFRILQGVGGAMLGANSMSLLIRATDQSRRARALGVFAAAQAVGVSAGPAVGGFLIGTLGWPSVFWLNVPFGIAAVIVGWMVLPVTELQHPNRAFDWRGALLLAPALTLVVLVLNQISALGPGSARSSLAPPRRSACFSRLSGGNARPDSRSSIFGSSKSPLSSAAPSPARSPTPSSTACSSLALSRWCAATATARRWPASSSRSFRSRSASSRRSAGL